MSPLLISHSNELGVIHLDLRMAIEQVEAQKEMILRLEDVNKHLETEQDRLHKGLQEAMAQISWLCMRVVILQEVLDDLSDDNNSDNDNKDSPDQGQDWMDEGSPPKSEDLSDSYQQLPISGSGVLYMEYVGGLNRLVLIVDETSPDGLDGEVLMEVAELIEGGVVPAFGECIFDRWLPPLFVWCKHCSV